MSLYKRGKVWWCTFSVNGNRYRYSTEHTNKELAKDVESGLRTAALQDEGKLPRKCPTLREFIPIFTAWVDLAQLSKDCQRDYKNCCTILKGTQLAGMRLDRITDDDVQATTLPGANGYKNHVVRTLRRLMSYAEGKRYVQQSPRLSLYEEHGRERVITPEEEKLLLLHCSPLLRDVFMLMLDSGLRRKEAATARIENIDWDAHTLFIVCGKTKKSRRRVPLSKRVFEALFIRVKDNKEGWLFRGKKQNHVGPDSLSRAFRRAARSAGIAGDVVLYDSRHTYGTAVYGATGNLKVVMEAMGHTDVKTAMRYQHPEMDIARKVIEKRNESVQ